MFIVLIIQFTDIAYANFTMPSSTYTKLLTVVLPYLWFVERCVGDQYTL